ncbi:MAG: outer membrane beta-barrel protein [Flavobacteriales bacterium]|nr:outer membrane beta-barrel protein [Flavobacteriales bacterium]
MRHLLLPSVTLLVFALLAGPVSFAQSNKRGTVHISLSGSAGFFSTKFDQEFINSGVLIKKRSTTDGTVARTIPLDFQFAITNLLSVGLYFEYGGFNDLNYGSYIDFASDTLISNSNQVSGRFIDTLASNSNKLYALGLSPRFYIMNKYRFNWMVGPEFGITVLKFTDVAVGFDNKKFADVHAGLHFRLATGVSYYFGKHFGLQAQVRYGMLGVKWRDRDPENTIFDSLDYASKFSASGVQVGLGITVRLGK